VNNDTINSFFYFEKKKKTREELKEYTCPLEKVDSEAPMYGNVVRNRSSKINLKTEILTGVVNWEGECSDEFRLQDEQCVQLQQPPFKGSVAP